LGNSKIIIKLLRKIDEWTQRFSFRDWERLWEKESFSTDFVYYRPSKSAFFFDSEASSYSDLTIQDVRIIENRIREFLDRKFEQLQSLHDSEPVLHSFQIPEEFRLSAEQYLLYFIQFLKDLGIEATGGIEQDGAHTLLKVVPDDKEVALDEIRKALETYLQLPLEPEVEILTQESDDYAVNDLVVQVNKLKYDYSIAQQRIQLMAKQKELDDREIIILKRENIDLREMRLIEQQAKLAPNGNAEDIIPDVLEADKLPFFGFNVNLGGLARILKRALIKKSPPKQLGEVDKQEDE
ncbi:MAG: hypothetical protein AAGC88_15595, partial [Bacteroidota bacterium]